MKALGARLVGVIVSAAISAGSVGCGPGLSHRVKAPEPTTDVFHAMDAELSHAMIGATTVTSGDAPPESRFSVTADEPPVAAIQTWGAGREIVSDLDSSDLDTRE